MAGDVAINKPRIQLPIRTRFMRILPIHSTLRRRDNRFGGVPEVRIRIGRRVSGVQAGLCISFTPAGLNLHTAPVSGLKRRHVRRSDRDRIRSARGLFEEQNVARIRCEHHAL